MKQVHKESSGSIKLQRALGKCVPRNAFIFSFCMMVNTIGYPGPNNLSYEAR